MNYSYLSASTGFLVAALQLCQLTVISIIAKAIIPVRANIHQLRVALNAKVCNHLCNAIHISVDAIIKDKAPRKINSLFSMYRISEILAPLSFRIPISFVRLIVAIKISPKRERQPITTAMMLKRIRHLKS